MQKPGIEFEDFQYFWLKNLTSLKMNIETEIVQIEVTGTPKRREICSVRWHEIHEKGKMSKFYKIS